MVHEQGAESLRELTNKTSERRKEMKTINPNIVRESNARQSAAGRYNPASVALIYKDGRRYSLVLPCGDSDEVYFWQEGNEVQCLCVNTRHDYCGLTVYLLGETVNKFSEKAQRFDGDETGSVFLQADHEIESALGRRGLDLSPGTIRKRLAEYCYA